MGDVSVTSTSGIQTSIKKSAPLHQDAAVFAHGYVVYMSWPGQALGQWRFRLASERTWCSGTAALLVAYRLFRAYVISEYYIV